ncbi:hypothetical protein FRB99_006177 [Tulasnella sp. 403]|nr:hypothetical protein FRB99_006177 [Tulasnella sp. 403]
MPIINSIPPRSQCINGKSVTGPLGTENCALQRSSGTYWNYPGQKGALFSPIDDDTPLLLTLPLDTPAVIVAQPGSDSSAVPGSGIAGFGLSAVQNPTDSLIGQYFANHTDINQFSFGLALNPQPSSNTQNTQNGQDSSGGTLSIFQPDPSLFTGEITTVSVAAGATQQNLGQPPSTLGSYDWTVQMQGWQFKGPSGQDVSGGSGTYVTVEPAYPYILLSQADAQAIYNAIPGSQPFTIPSNAVTSAGTPVFQDPQAQSYSIPCSTSGVSLTVNFGGLAIPVQPSDLLTSIGGVCVGNVKGWLDPNKQNYIFGSSFLRGAYIIFTANPNGQSNTIGFANRLFQSKKSTNTTGPIVGGVVGGIAFIALVGVLAWLYIRRRRMNTVPPSATFTSSGGFATQDESEKKHRSFLGFGSKDKNEGNLVAEPWAPPKGDSSAESGDHVVVQPWQPTAVAEQAFLSPTGTSNFSTSQHHSTGTALTPPPPTATPGTHTSPPGSPGYNNYDRPLSGQSGYSALPNPQGQAMWVERR